MDELSDAPEIEVPAPSGFSAGKTRRKRLHVHGGAYRDRIDHWRDASNGEFVLDPSKLPGDGLFDETVM